MTFGSLVIIADDLNAIRMWLSSAECRRNSRLDGLCGCPQSGRPEPLVYVGGRFGLTSSSDKPFAPDAVRGASRLFSQALSFVGQALI
jgi:hypothetical protein